ncbi:MAG: ABC transporter ATP-binding protein [Desulfitobacteriia bacterium]|jgi:ABC-2 type transport system ATP-binding protein
MSVILSVQDISKSFGQSTVVDHISFEVQKGEILGLVGPNGAGKSTIIRCILGIIHQDSGTITYHLDESQKLNTSKIGYLPEERGLYKDAKIMDILMYMASLKNYPLDKARQRADNYFEKFDLKGRAKAKIEELSKGMAQKVQFIASIIHEPELLVLDEPLSGFDPVSQNLFMEEIKSLAARGTSILLSSHQMNMVESLCHRIFMIDKGRRVLYGNLDSIKDRYANYRCEILGNNDPSRFSRLPYVQKVEQDGQKHIIHLQSGTSPSAFLRELPPDIEIKEMNLTRISLHDIFVKTVTGGI